jgi:hypothetical protein
VTDQAEYASLLSHWTGKPLQDARITRVAELSPQLKLPARLVALATAKQNGVDGWVVLDGPRSAWYPKHEQPERTLDSVILKIHLGWQLLGFRQLVDRPKYLANRPPERDPQRFLAAYERLLLEAETPGSVERQKELLCGWRSPLGRHFKEYVQVYAEQNGKSREIVLVELYSRYLKLASQVDPTIHDEVYESSGILKDNFDDYVEEILKHTEGQAEALQLTQLFAPHWDHILGYGRMGSVAFRCGNRKLAEPFLQKLRDGFKDYFRAAQMSQLAEIWFDRGDRRQASELLVDCLQKLVTKIKESKYNSDRATYAKEFQHHRSTYLRLFPEGEGELSKAGLPLDPLN